MSWWKKDPPQPIVVTPDGKYNVQVKHLIVHKGFPSLVFEVIASSDPRVPVGSEIYQKIDAVVSTP